MGSTLLQKIFFKAMQELRDQGLPQPRLNFIRYHYGPYSESLKAGETYLKKSGFLLNEKPTPRAKAVLEKFRPRVSDEMGKVEKVVVSIAKARAAWSAQDAKEEAYRVSARMPDGKLVRMSDVPIGTPFSTRAEGDKILTLSPHLLVDLSLALSSPERLAAGKRKANTTDVLSLLRG